MGFFLGLNKTEQFDKKFHIIHAYENRSANDLKPVKIDWSVKKKGGGIEFAIAHKWLALSNMSQDLLFCQKTKAINLLPPLLNKMKDSIIILHLQKQFNINACT